MDLQRRAGKFGGAGPGQPEQGGRLWTRVRRQAGGGACAGREEGEELGTQLTDAPAPAVPAKPPVPGAVKKPPQQK